VNKLYIRQLEKKMKKTK